MTAPHVAAAVVAPAAATEPVAAVPRVLPPAAPRDDCRRYVQDALLWERYLYEDHTRKQISGWARRLRYFRFCRAYGGHAGGGDQLKAAVRLENEASLLGMCGALGIAMVPMPTAEELAKFPLGRQPTAAPGFPAWQQPGDVGLDGMRLFCWVSAFLVKDAKENFTGERIPMLELMLSDADNIWDVTDACVAQAEAFEALLEPFASRLIDPPQDDRNCISPKRYPEMFGLWHRATAEWPWGDPDPH